MSYSEICLGCMNPKGDNQECHTCGYVEGTPQVLPFLAPGTILANRFLIGRHLRANGEGATYIALDRKSGRRVDVREYLPKKICTRRSGNDTVVVRENAKAVYEDYLNDFLDVSRAVSRLGRIPEIVPLIDIFECNNTAYAVYEHVEGKPLTELVRRAKRLTWEEAAPLFAPLLSAVASAHSSGLVHFGISPESILMTHSGRLVLTDFGVPDARIAETELEAQLYDGFAALEQYSLDARKGKWTDVYALSAVMLFALTGKRPPDAPSRLRDARLNVSSDLADTLPSYVVSALACGLQVNPEKRIPTVDELREELFPGKRSGARYEAAPMRESQERPTSRPQNSVRSESAQKKPSRPAVESSEDSFGNRMKGTFRDVGDKLGGYISDFRNRRSNEPDTDAGQDDSTPWYMNLKQWQYALLSTSLTIVILGIIAVIAFLSIRSEITGKEDHEPTIEIIQIQSDSDISIDPSQPVTVPKFVGQIWDSELEGKYFTDFYFMFSAREYSDDYPEGTVCKQSIKPDSEVSKGTPIVLTISLGSKKCKIPDIIGDTVVDAHTKLDEAGLLMGEQEEEYSDSYPAGTVIRIVGASVGSTMERNSMVSVVVSLGPEE